MQQSRTAYLSRPGDTRPDADPRSLRGPRRHARGRSRHALRTACVWRVAWLTPTCTSFGACGRFMQSVESPGAHKVQHTSTSVHSVKAPPPPRVSVIGPETDASILRKETRARQHTPAYCQHPGQLAPPDLFRFLSAAFNLGRYSKPIQVSRDCSNVLHTLSPSLISGSFSLLQRWKAKSLGAKGTKLSA